MELNLRDIIELVMLVLGAAGIYWKLERKIALMGQKLEDTVEKIRDDIKRLETKQDRYNNLQERMIKAEVKINEMERRK